MADTSISIKKSDILKEVRLQAAYVGNKQGATPEEADKITMLSTQDEAVEKAFSKALDQVLLVAGLYISSCTASTTETGTYTIIANTPSDAPSTYSTQVEGFIKEALIRTTLTAWFDIALPEYSEGTKAKASEALQELLFALSQRKRPATRTTTPSEASITSGTSRGSFTETEASTAMTSGTTRAAFTETEASTAMTSGTTRGSFTETEASTAMTSGTTRGAFTETEASTAMTSGATRGAFTETEASETMTSGAERDSFTETEASEAMTSGTTRGTFTETEASGTLSAGETRPELRQKTEDEICNETTTTISWT